MPDSTEIDENWIGLYKMKRALINAQPVEAPERSGEEVLVLDHAQWSQQVAEELVKNLNEKTQREQGKPQQ